MRRASGAVVVALVTLLVCCSAESHQEGESDRYDGSGHKARNLDSLGGGHMIRRVRQIPQYLFPGYLSALPYAPSILRNPQTGVGSLDETDATSMPLGPSSHRSYGLRRTDDFSAGRR